ncbi:aldehyde dehydrogenase family protein [Mycolicibacterium parafortuitum]|uniref:Aldehyde dehydrogenase [Frankia sp. EAN1pec] n=1 Tax=Mycolicibacterium parafortuitum TaxID=39692 RepID=A0A375YIP5_MYCPF|nr:aldehyde dehydrogenase family protein [Mycolicibacterium parafortuitum]ORB32278.1 aldehyde dehydrogenase [Mycolicibacterium parafortuitum]SRX80963.1 aldehyde dehydrogenase [Frankia sp. EAN1pec] [Mycolicibacterium parafortuitum]
MTSTPLATRGLYIDGAWTEGQGTTAVPVLNPATEDVIAEVPEATPADVDAAVAAARRAFDDGPWPTMKPAERAKILGAMAEKLTRRRAELVELNIAEAGSTRMLADFLQVGTPIDHFVDMVERVLPQFPFQAPVPPVIGHGIGQGIVTREPYGVAALITAFNFPFLLNLAKLAPALAAGCTVVLKSSPYTPLEALVLGEVAEAAGLPPGTLNIVTGDVAAGERLTRHPGVDLVSFTGSDAVGRKVYAQGAESMKKVVLELGGKSANIILDDANLDAVLESVLAGIITHAGQGCALLTRILVHESLHDDLVARIVGTLGFISVGDPSDPATMMGPLIRDVQRRRVESLIASGVEDGAQIAFGGKRPAHLDRGFFLEPTLFVGVDNSMRIAQEEFFGPVGVVIPFRDDDDAVRIANDSRYGLGGGVWSADPQRAATVAHRLRTGMVVINGGGGGLNPAAPFGGYKNSGIGREFGEYGLSEYLQHKALQWPVK